MIYLSGNLFRFLFSSVLVVGSLFSPEFSSAGNIGNGHELPSIPSKPLALSVPRLLSLEEAMQIAIKAHPQYRQAIHTYEANKEIIGQAMSNYYPHLSVGAGYTYETGNFVISPGFPPSLYNLILPPNNTGFDYYQAQANVSETLFTFGQRITQVRQARHNAMSSEHQALWTLWSLLANVEIAYDTFAQDELLVDAAEKTLKDYDDQLHVANGEFQVGTASKFDVLNAEVNRSNAKLNLITARNNVKVARVGLLNAMGVVYGGQFNVITSLHYVAMDKPLDALLHHALERRPDLLSMKEQEKADRQNELYYKSTYLPSVGATAGYSYASIFFPLTYNWFLGATISVPIFSGFLTVHQVSQAQKTLSAARDAEEGLRQNLLMQVKQDYFNMETAAERINTTRALLSQAQESLRLAEGQYRVGVGSAVAVTQAEADLAAARGQYVQAVYGYKIARANLIRDTGMDPLRQIHERNNKGVVAHE
ncbi:MAG: TolC family protein [Leptospirales bacterium]